MTAFAPPETTVSSMVLYMPHADAPPSPALVTKVGSRTLDLFVMGGASGGVQRNGVHHESDPGLQEFPDWRPAGTWKEIEVKPDTRLAMLHEKVALLEKKFDSLKGK
jgi:hypothetical protein